MLRISENFSVDEFLVSSTATRMGYQFTMDRYERENIERLVRDVLQPARTSLGVPFVITSGYRPAWLNKKIGGAANSRHMYGCAADFKVPGVELAQAFGHIKALELPIDQLILEDPPAGWIHAGIALPGEAPRYQYMIAHRTADGGLRYERI